MGRIIALVGAAVFAAVVALYFLVVRGDEAPAAPVTGSAKQAAPASGGPDTPTHATTPSGPVRSGRLPPIVRPTRDRPADPAPTAPPTVEVAEPPADAGPKKFVPPLFRQLREQVLDTETWVAECNERAHKAGKKLDGLAAYWFKVERAGNKIVVSTTGVEYTGLEDAASNDCIRETAKKMSFETLPEGVQSVTAFRKVTFKDGQLLENWMSFYTTDPPTPTPYDPAPAPTAPPANQ